MITSDFSEDLLDPDEVLRKINLLKSSGAHSGKYVKKYEIENIPSEKPYRLHIWYFDY